MKYRTKPVSHYEGFDDYGDSILTANEVIENDPAPTFTGLYNADGDEIHRVRESVAFGFRPKS